MSNFNVDSINILKYLSSFWSNYRLYILERKENFIFMIDFNRRIYGIHKVLVKKF